VRLIWHAFRRNVNCNASRHSASKAAFPEPVAFQAEVFQDRMKATKAFPELAAVFLVVEVAIRAVAVPAAAVIPAVAVAVPAVVAAIPVAAVGLRAWVDAAAEVRCASSLPLLACKSP
jgi:hypothetical protein